jgi:hypothetical protein
MPDLKKKKMKHLLFVIDFFTEAFASVECLGCLYGSYATVIYVFM